MHRHWPAYQGTVPYERCPMGTFVDVQELQSASALGQCGAFCSAHLKPGIFPQDCVPIENMFNLMSS